MLSRDKIHANLKLIEAQIRFLKELMQQMSLYPEKFPDAKILSPSLEEDEKTHKALEKKLDGDSKSSITPDEKVSLKQIHEESSVLQKSLDDVSSVMVTILRQQVETLTPKIKEALAEE